MKTESEIKASAMEELVNVMNDSKAAAVRDFVNTMIGARESGFIDRSNLSLAELHHLANMHIVDCYDAEYISLRNEWGDVVSVLCKPDSETWGTDFYPPIGEPCQMLWNSKPLEYIKILPVGFDTEGFLVYQELSDEDELFGRGYPHIRGDENPKYIPIDKSNGAIANG
jgi:hypothetical protein